MTTEPTIDIILRIKPSSLSRLEVTKSDLVDKVKSDFVGLEELYPGVFQLWVYPDRIGQ